MSVTIKQQQGGIQLRRLSVGALEVNCFLLARIDGRVGGEGETPCVVVDPGDEAERIAATCRSIGWRPELVLFTHAHYDHIGGAAGVLASFPGSVLGCSTETARRAVEPRLNLSVLLGAVERAPAATRLIADGETFTAAGIEFIAKEIPGHDPGELVYYVKEMGWCFAGDTVFAGGIGRSDFPGGDGRALVESLVAYLATLPPETKLFPGHGPETTAGRELKTNPFLLTRK